MSHKNKVLHSVQRSAVFLLLLFFSGAPPAQNIKPHASPCPPDMAWIEAGGFCMDRYEFPNIKGVQPIRDLEFEEADRLCKLSGKRIPSRAEWRLACGGVAKDLFPYGRKYVANRCRSGLDWNDGPAPGGNYPECARGGVYDLTGNVWEWVWQDKEGSRRYIAGGAWNTGPDHANCLQIMRLNFIVMSPSVGVRCVLSPSKTMTVAPDSKTPAPLPPVQ